MENTHIEWADHTFNPWIGCTKVSPGCQHCYAEALNKRWRKGQNWGSGAPRQRTSAANWRQPLKWNRDVWAQCPKCGVKQPHSDVCIVPDCLTLGSEMARLRPRIFCASLADWLDDEVPIEWLADLLKLIHDTPNLDWLLLTKRPENWFQRCLEALAHIEGIDPVNGWDSVDALSEVGEWLNDWLGGTTDIPSNIWIGTTVEDQARADERIPALLEIPAKVRFLSCEPLLEKVDLSYRCLEVAADWVICGGESGPGARPMHPDWARSLRDQCTAAGVPFFFKQWGEYLHDEIPTPVVTMGEDTFYKESEPRRIGKRAAGRLLDGREWNDLPQPEVAAR